jgi:hypothetical protein
MQLRPTPLSTIMLALACGLSASAQAQSAAGREISCSPSVVRPGDTLTITTRNPLPQLSVRVPDKKIGSLFLVNDFDPAALMHSRDFMQQKGAVLPVAMAAMKSGEKVFTRPGVYVFSASTNLETDDGTPQYMCRVTYKNQ